MQSGSHPAIDCPVCSTPLQVLAVGRILLDVCHGGCGGIWFDHFELQRFDERHEGEGAIAAHVERHPDLTRDPKQRLRCPRCRDVVLRQHFFSVKRRVEVDSCPGCGGYWLDHGELALIRDEFATAMDRQKAATKFLDDIDNQHVSSPCPVALNRADRAHSLSAMLKLVGSRYV